MILHFMMYTSKKQIIMFLSLLICHYFDDIVFDAETDYVNVWFYVCKNVV